MSHPPHFYTRPVMPAVNAWFMVILAFMLGAASTWLIPRANRYQLRSYNGRMYRFDTASGHATPFTPPREAHVITDEGTFPIGSPELDRVNRETEAP